MSRTLLMIPGPIEFDGEVLRALAGKTDSHVSPDFIERFGNVLRMLRDVFRAPNGQPFVVAGSGTLAMELAAANVVEPGDRAVLVNTGYFSDRYAQLLQRHGAQVEQVRAPLGETPSAQEVESALERTEARLLVATHVDTSTGVRVDAEELTAVARRHDALTIFDGVCATAGERFEQDAWGADIYLTGSQKALGVPPGLAVLVASQRALERWKQRQRPVSSLYCDWAEWLPIMQAYEAGRPAYFATPPVNLIDALEVSLQQILAEGMERRWARHERIAGAFRSGWEALGLRLVPEASVAANTLSTLYYPDGVDGSLIGHIKAAGVVVAGGLHPDIRTGSFRVGHMGAVNENDLLASIGAVERGLLASGYTVEEGAGVCAAQQYLEKRKTQAR